MINAMYFKQCFLKYMHSKYCTYKKKKEIVFIVELMVISDEIDKTKTSVDINSYLR